MTEKISYDVVKAYLLELAHRNPDKKADCYYSAEAATKAAGGYLPEDAFDDEGEVIAQTPCCIVGQMVFDFAGIEGLRSLPEDTSVGLFGPDEVPEQSSYMGAKRLSALNFSTEAIRLAGFAQNGQDAGNTWDTAVSRAIDAVEKGNNHV